MKRSTLLSAVIIALMATPYFAHAGWTRTYGGDEADVGCYILEINDGSFVVLGKTKSFGAGETDLWLLKLNIDGDTVWTRIYGGESWDHGSRVEVTNDEGYLIFGETRSFGDGSWVLETDNVGDTLWTQVLSKGGYTEQTPDGGYLIIGQHGFYRLNSAGEVVYSKDYNEYFGTSVLACSSPTSDGCYIIAAAGGYVYKGLAKIDDTGEVVWQSSQFLPQVNSINYIHEGHQGYVFVGPTWGPELPDSVQHFDLRAAEVDTIYGHDIWSIDCGSSPAWETGYCIKPTADGGYIIAADPWTLLKLDGYGHHIWSREYGGIGRYVEPTSDGGYVVVGEKNRDLFIVKTDSLGYVGVEEPVPVTHLPDWEVTPIGSQIVLRYSDNPDGFHASIFDATGRKVDEVHATGESGIITWGNNHSSGVYFIRPTSGGKTTTLKIILTK